MAKSTSGASTPSNPMTATAAARIQSAGAKANGGGVSKGGFAARAQSAAAKSGNR